MMESRFSAEFFAGNRARLRELFAGTAPIVLTANGLLQRGGDSTYLFQQDASFWYLTGIEEPDIVLVMDKDKEYLIVPEREAIREAFDGVLDTRQLAQRSGIETILPEKDGWKQLGARLKRVKHVATLAALPTYVEHYGMYANPARAALADRLHVVNPELELLDLRLALARLRMIKQPAELAAIQTAIDITVDTLKDISRPGKLAKYAHEYELEADITRGFRRRGAAGHSFNPIVAGGERACTIHNMGNNAALAASELVVLDVGAEVEHYAADITRTYSVGGQPSRRQQAIFAAVRDVQQFALEMLKPGTILKEYEAKIEHFMGEKLRELGLIKTINHDNVREYYPHASSHFLGLDVHDAGDYERPLEPNVVLTCEPGIYVAAEGIGVRLEDDVLITPDGHDVLSTRLPRTLV
jgi:Xaa-Pro aminopeptidase